MTESLRLRSLLIAGVSAAAMLGGAAQAFAQDTVVGEVVVTAQRREESLQEVPIAVTAISSEALQSSSFHSRPQS